MSKWSQQPGALPSTASGVSVAWELACDHVEVFPLAEGNIAAVWPWFHSIGFRPEEVLWPRIC